MHLARVLVSTCILLSTCCFAQQRVLVFGQGQNGGLQPLTMDDQNRLRLAATSALPQTTSVNTDRATIPDGQIVDLYGGTSKTPSQDWSAWTNLTVYVDSDIIKCSAAAFTQIMWSYSVDGPYMIDTTFVGLTPLQAVSYVGNSKPYLKVQSQCSGPSDCCIKVVVTASSGWVSN